jgi:hypothetical protein
VFRLFEELSVLNSDGSEKMVLFFFSDFRKLLDERRARMNNRMGKAEA